MTIPAESMALLRARLSDALAVAGCTIEEISEHPGNPPVGGSHPGRKVSAASFLARMVRAKMGPSVMPVVVRVRGWGQGFQSAIVQMRTGLDPALPAEAAVDATLQHLTDSIAAQYALHLRARMCGIEHPLRGQALASIDHLKIDPDAITALTTHLGSAEAVRDWVRTQMELRRQEVEHDVDPHREQPTITIDGDTMLVPFALRPLHPTRSPSGDHVPWWEDGTVFLGGTLPDTALSAAVGRPLSDIVSGTPIGHRLIETITAGDDGIFAPGQSRHILVELETPRIPVKEALGI